MNSARILTLSFLAVLWVPGVAFALTLTQVANLFNIFVGIMLTVAILLFVGGLGGYFVWLGTWPSHRDVPIRVMEWGVAVLFALIVILAVVQLFQTYTVIITTIISIAAVVAVFGFVLYGLTASSSAEKKEK